MTLNLPPNSFWLMLLVGFGADIPPACSEMSGVRCPG